MFYKLSITFVLFIYLFVISFCFIWVNAKIERENNGWVLETSYWDHSRLVFQWCSSKKINPIIISDIKTICFRITQNMSKAIKKILNKHIEKSKQLQLIHMHAVKDNQKIPLRCREKINVWWNPLKVCKCKWQWCLKMISLTFFIKVDCYKHKSEKSQLKSDL